MYQDTEIRPAKYSYNTTLRIITAKVDRKRKVK